MPGVLRASWMVLPLMFLLGFQMVEANEGATSKRPQIPRAAKVEGSPEVFQGNEGPWRKVKAGEVYLEKAKFRLGQQDRLEMEIHGKRVLKFSAESRFEFPGIRFETGETPLVVLESGTVRWTAADLESGSARLTSAFFDFAPPAGDFIFRVDPKKAVAEALVVKGEMRFQPLNSEESAVLKSMQRVLFQGVIEEGEIAYDILLQGRRIPRGKLQAVRPLTEAEMKPFLDEEKAAARALEAEKQAAARRKAADAKVNRICSAPTGKLFECAWTCEGSRAKAGSKCPLEAPGIQCVRTRCNANGEWADRAVLEGAEARRHCQKVVQVGPCGG